MTDLRTAAQQALEALEGYRRELGDQQPCDAEQALEAALAEPEPCQYPDCVDNGPDGKCIRWLLDECSKSEDYKPQRPAEPVQEPDSPERRCGGPGCDMRCCQPVQEPVARVRVNSNVPGRINELDLLRPLPRGEHFLYTPPPQRPAEPQGCDHCNHPLYAAVKCRVCERVTEPVQEPVAWRWGYRSVTTGEMDWRGYVEIAAHPNLRSPEIIMEPLYTAPPQRPAEPVQEPVAWADKISFESAMKIGKGHDVWPKAGDYETRTGRALIGLYATPPQRPPLTDDQLDDIAVAARRGNLYDLRIAIERALKIREKE